MSDSNLSACEYCNRMVLAGPPCCYKNVYNLYQSSQKEVKWLRKIQSKQAKRIKFLKTDRLAVQTILALSTIVLIVSLFFLLTGN